jgi:hypothetical protein
MSHQTELMSGKMVPPGPSPELKGRVVATAREAMNRTGEPDVWMWIWESRPARIVWAASIGVLIFCHLAIGGPVSARPAKPAIPLAAAAGSNDELAEIIGLQRMTVDLPAWGFAPKDAIATTNRSIGNEDPS